MSSKKSAQAEPVVEIHPLLAPIYFELDQLYAAAKIEADGYWRDLDRHQKKYKNRVETWWKHSVRVRKARVTDGRSLSIEWSYNIFVGEKGERRPISKYIKRGHTPKYPQSRFARAMDNELVRIMEAEELFGPIRQRADCLHKARRHILAYLKHEGMAPYEELEVKSRARTSSDTSEVI